MNEIVSTRFTQGHSAGNGVKARRRVPENLPSYVGRVPATVADGAVRRELLSPPGVSPIKGFPGGAGGQSPPQIAAGAGSGLDTLAQPRQTDPEQATGHAPSTRERLLRRARAKFFSLPLAVALAVLRTSLELSYRNSAYCTASLNQADGKITGTYCGNRWCMVCNRIRTGRAFQRYLPVIARWQDKWLVTLTLRNVPAALLSQTVKEMIRDFQGINLAMRRTDHVKLIALRKLECTYNERTDEYHPHFHIVVNGEVAARLLVKRWLERHPDTADVKGQDIRTCDDDSLREVLKYFTKLLTKTRGPANTDGRSAPISPAALDVIFRAMKGQRVYQPVGFTIAKAIPDEGAEAIEPVEATDAPSRGDETVQWQWSQRLHDWVDPSTGELLTGYEPTENFRRLVDRFSATLPADVDPPSGTPTPPRAVAQAGRSAASEVTDAAPRSSAAPSALALTRPDQAEGVECEPFAAKV
jgi:hypothetical protein